MKKNPLIANKISYSKRLSPDFASYTKRMVVNFRFSPKIGKPDELRRTEIIQFTQIRLILATMFRDDLYSNYQYYFLVVSSNVI